MEDFLKKSVMLGVGIAAITEEKARKIVAELRKAGKVDKKESRKMVESLIRQSRKEAENLRKAIEAEVRVQMRKAEVVTASQLRNLEKRVGGLSKAKAKKSYKKPKKKSGRKRR